MTGQRENNGGFGTVSALFGAFQGGYWQHYLGCVQCFFLTAGIQPVSPNPTGNAGKSIQWYPIPRRNTTKNNENSKHCSKRYWEASNSRTRTESIPPRWLFLSLLAKGLNLLISEDCIGYFWIDSLVFKSFYGIQSYGFNAIRHQSRRAAKG